MGKEGSPRPLSHLYQRGLMTRKELVRLSQPLGNFLRDHGLGTRVSNFSNIADRFGAEGEIFSLKKISGWKVRWDGFYVDTEIMKERLPHQLRIYIRELKESKYPKRTEEEKKIYRDRVLREKGEDGNFHPISFEDAYERLTRDAVSYFGGNSFANDAEDLAQELFIRISPFLKGERGNFLDFSHLRRYFFSAARNLLVDAYRSRRLRQKTVSNYVREQKDQPSSLTDGQALPEQVYPPINVSLRPSEERLIALHVQYDGNWIAIVSVLGLPFSAIPAMKGRYVRLLNKINPKRKKSNRGGSYLKIDDGLLVEEYRNLREETLRIKGKIPASTDIEYAREQGCLSCAPVTLTTHFGGNWSKAQARLEELIKETG